MSSSRSSLADPRQRRASVLNVLEKAFDMTIEEHHQDLPLTDLGLESIMVEELAGEFSKEFGINFREIDFHSGRMSTINKLVEALPSLADEAATEVEQPETVPESPRKPCADVLVTGMSCRLPGGIDSGDALWESLKGKKNSISCRAPKNRPGFEKDFPGGYIPDLDHFNAR